MNYSLQLEIVNLYQSGLSPMNIIRKLSLECCRDTIYNILHKFSIKSIGGAILRRKYKLNENFFDIIDTEEKAYWLGFIMADGCINGKSLQITLNNQDRRHLIKFLENIESNYKIYDYGDYSYLSIRSQKIVQTLSRYGIVPRKTFKTYFPKQITKNLQRHFIRGILDGDGCIHVGKQGQKRIHFSGTRVLMQQIQEILMLNCSVSMTKLGKTKNTYVLMYCGNKQAKRILNYLYCDANIYLDRKFRGINI